MALFPRPTLAALAAAVVLSPASAQAPKYTLQWIEVGGSWSSKPIASNDPYCVPSNPATCGCNKICGKRVPLNNEIDWHKDGCKKPSITIRCTVVGDKTQTRTPMDGKQLPWATVGAWKVVIQGDKDGRFSSCLADLPANARWGLRIVQRYKEGANYTKVLTTKEMYVYDKSGVPRAGGGQQPASYTVDGGPVRAVTGAIGHYGSSLRVPWSDEIANGRTLNWLERNETVAFQLGDVRRVVKELETCTVKTGER